jgi:hypothetical protein
MGTQVQAGEFSEGELTGSFDTTISYGASWRVEERDDNLVAKAHHNPFIGAPGVLNSTKRDALGRWSNNADDGNLNYDDGDLISHAIKLTSELDLQYRDMGAFFRASYFYDFENSDHPGLSSVAKNDFVGDRFRLLDAYVYKDFEIAEHFGTIRIGRQVVSWGESTFIQGGINVINPVDVSKLQRRFCLLILFMHLSTSLRICPSRRSTCSSLSRSIPTRPALISPPMILAPRAVNTPC